MKLRKLPRVHLPVLSRETSAPLLVTARFAALLLLFALLSRAARSAAMPTVTIGMPGGGEIEQTATCSGTIMPQKETRILLPEDVTVTEVLVQAGQAVQAGDVLLCLSGEELQNKLDTLDAQIAQLRAQKKQLTVQPNYAPTDPITDAQLALQRAQEDQQRCLENPDTSEDAQLAADRAVQDAEMALQRALDTYAEQQRQADASNAVSSADAAVLQQQIEALLEEQKEYEALLETDGKVLADTAGIITAVYAVVGSSCDGIAVTLGETGSGWLLNLEMETEAFQDFPGQPSEIEVAQGSVSGNGSLQHSWESDGKTTLSILLDDSNWTSGGAEAVLRFPSQHYTTCLPVSALHQDSSGWYVYLVESTSSILGVENKLTALPVTLLEKNDTTAAVEGISLQAKVAIRGDKPLYAGDTVKVAAS